jgi:hypothetical protein
LTKPGLEPENSSLNQIFWVPHKLKRQSSKKSFVPSETTQKVSTK